MDQAGTSSPRDPRFDPRVAGRSNPRHYAFLDKTRQDEIQALKRALKKEKEPQKRDKIQQAIRRLNSKLAENSNKSKRNLLISELKAKSKSKWHNVRKSDITKNLLVAKFKELKQSGKLSKYLERKRKKLINRDKKSMLLE